MQFSYLHLHVAKLLHATMETEKGDAKCQFFSHYLNTAESQGTSMLARAKEHMGQNKPVKYSFSVCNLPFVFSQLY